MNLSVKIFISLILSVIVGLILGEENLPWLKAYLAPWYNVHQSNQNDYCTCSISIFSLWCC